MTTPYSCILFDLDGTIVDSAPGILESLRFVYRELGLPVPSTAELMRWVGPPILDSFRDLAHLDVEESARALAIYREDYITHGVNDATIFAGMPEVLAAVKAAGIPFSLATSKPEVPATAILEHAGLLDLFTVITGASADEVRSAKKDVVAEALIRLRALGADTSRPVLIGDRIHDVEGATANGVPTIMVEWGYGTPEERTDAIATVTTPDELLALIL
ncbi:HAD-IA family hydrolase [soil metagenome]